MGIRSSPTMELVFDNCRIPAENLLAQEGEGFKIAMKTLDGGRIGIAAQALGIAQGAFEAAAGLCQGAQAVRSADRRFPGGAVHARRHGDPHRGGAAAGLPGGVAGQRRALLRQGVGDGQAGASETAMWVTTKAVQVHGGYGYTREFPVERMMRDAKITEIYEGTSEVQRIVIGTTVTQRLTAEQSIAKGAGYELHPGNLLERRPRGGTLVPMYLLALAAFAVLAAGLLAAHPGLPAGAAAGAPRSPGRPDQVACDHRLRPDQGAAGPRRRHRPRPLLLGLRASDHRHHPDLHSGRPAPSRCSASRFLKGTFYLLFSVVLDLAGLVAIAMLLGLAVRRYLVRPAGLPNGPRQRPDARPAAGHPGHRLPHRGRAHGRHRARHAPGRLVPRRPGGRQASGRHESRRPAHPACLPVVAAPAAGPRLHRPDPLHPAAPSLPHPGQLPFCRPRPDRAARHPRSGGRGRRELRRRQARRPVLEGPLRRRRLHLLQALPGPLPGLRHRQAPLADEGRQPDPGTRLHPVRGRPDRDHRPGRAVGLHHLPRLPGDLPGCHRTRAQDRRHAPQPGADGRGVPRRGGAKLPPRPSRSTATPWAWATPAAATGRGNSASSPSPKTPRSTCSTSSAATPPSTSATSRSPRLRQTLPGRRAQGRHPRQSRRSAAASRCASSATSISTRASPPRTSS